MISAIVVTVAGALVHLILVGIQRVRTKIHEKYFAKKEEKADVLILTC